MSFITGLKNLFRKPIYTVIVILFIIAWILILIGYSFIDNIQYNFILFQMIGVLGSFTILLFLISFFKSIDKLHIGVVIIVFLISLFIILIFEGFMKQFSTFFLIINQIVTAFFAFKICIDSSTKIDDYLYNNPKYRKLTRILEFIIFGILNLLILNITWRILLARLPKIAKMSVNIFRIVIWIDLILIGAVVLRLIFTKKFSAYISLFFILIFFYILYIIIDVIAEFIFFNTTYAWYSFVIDLSLFLYIVGSIFDKVDYIKSKLKIIRAATISLFIIIMKLYAQVVKILPLIIERPLDPRIFLDLQVWLLFMFLIFTLLFGIYSIFVHKEGKTS